MGIVPEGSFCVPPKDLVSLVFFYQVNSPYLVDNLNTLHASGRFAEVFENLRRGV